MPDNQPKHRTDDSYSEETPPGGNDANRSARSSSLIIAFLICALLLAGIWLWRRPDTGDVDAADFEFQAIKIDADKLQTQRDEKFKSVRLDRVTKDWQSLLTAARDVNRLDFNSPGQAQKAAAIEKLGYLTNEIIPATGYEGFVAASLPLRDECRAGLDALREALEAGDLELHEAKVDPPAQRFAKYRANCGNQLPMLLKRGLLNDQGAWTTTNAPIIADILGRYRWAHLVRDQYSPWLLLTPYEIEIFARWRIEQAKGYSTEKRLKFIAEIVRFLPDYNADFARGILAYKENNIPESLNYFEILAKNNPEAGYQAYIRYLKEHRSGAGGDGASK